MDNDNNSVEALHQHFDVLQEISNIGSGNAATALANLLNRKVNVGIPRASLLDFSSIADQVGGLDKTFVGILVKLTRDVDGMMIFLLSLDSANVLIETMLGNTRDKDNLEFTEIEYSLMKEIGNILSGSYLSSLNTLTNLQIMPSIPYLSIDMAGAILSVPAIEFGKIGDRVLFIESRLDSGDGLESKDITGYFILVPEVESFGVILRSLGVI